MTEDLFELLKCPECGSHAYTVLEEEINEFSGRAYLSIMCIRKKCKNVNKARMFEFRLEFVEEYSI